MIRLSRMTDYGVVVMTHLARNDGVVRTAPDVADEVGLPVSTVSAVLKSLARAGLLESHRGVKGGYSLTRAPEQVPMADLIEALEGPVALTACVDGRTGGCDVEVLCPMRGGWDKINKAIRRALTEVTLADMLGTPPLFDTPGAPYYETHGKAHGRAPAAE